jgi:hypothetical protein
MALTRYEKALIRLWEAGICDRSKGSEDWKRMQVIEEKVRAAKDKCRSAYIRRKRRRFELGSIEAIRMLKKKGRMECHS